MRSDKSEQRITPSHIQSAHFAHLRDQNEQIRWPTAEKPPQDSESAHSAPNRNQSEQIECGATKADSESPPPGIRSAHFANSHGQNEQIRWVTTNPSSESPHRTSNPLTLHTLKARMSKSDGLEPKNRRRTANLLILRYCEARMSKSDGIEPKIGRRTSDLLNLRFRGRIPRTQNEQIRWVAPPMHPNAARRSPTRTPRTHALLPRTKPRATRQSARFCRLPHSRPHDTLHTA